MKTISISVTGLVQGVFYRANTERVARELGLLGWVKNEDDGSVSIVVQGEKEKLDRLVEWCHEGPEGAEVEKVEVKEIITEEELGEFCVRY